MKLLFIILLNFVLLFRHSIVFGYSNEPKVSLSENGFPFAVEFSTPTSLSFDEFREKYLILDPKISFDKIPHRQSRKDVTHEKFVQRYNGIPVEGSGYNLHYIDGKVFFINGHYTHIANLNTNPRLTDIEAKNAFCRSASIPLDSVYKYRAELLIREVSENNGADFIAKLAYRIVIYSSKVKNGIVTVYIDARTGDLLETITEDHLIKAEGNSDERLDSDLNIPGSNNLRKVATPQASPATGTFSTRYSGLPIPASTMVLISCLTQHVNQ
jgi:Zn-dependent metalloprotease